MSVLNVRFNSVFYLEIKRSFMGSLQIILWRIQMAEVCSLRDFTLLLQLNWENKIKNMKVTKII